MTIYTNDIGVGTTVFVPYGDHTYSLLTLLKKNAVFNRLTYAWSEYVGEDYLEEGDEVHEVWVVE